MEYAVLALALPVVLMIALLGLERVERWIDNGGPRTEPRHGRPVPAQSTTPGSQRSAHAIHPGRRRPIRMVRKPATSRAHHRPIRLE